jgi:hypothetical protein
MEVNHEQTGRHNVEWILGQRKDQKLAFVSMMINTNGNFFKLTTRMTTGFSIYTSIHGVSRLIRQGWIMSRTVTVTI